MLTLTRNGTFTSDSAAFGSYTTLPSASNTLYPRILIRAFLRVIQNLKRALLALAVSPALADTVPSDHFTAAGILRVILRQVPFLDDGAKLLHISQACGMRDLEASGKVLARCR